MPKKKTTPKRIAKVSVASSFFTIHRHARWLLLLFILVTVLFIVVNHKADVKEDTALTNLLIQASDDTIAWKTYMNPAGEFSIQYPKNWKLVESHEQSNREVDDPSEINTATLSGRDGEIVLQWGPMGFGGGCDEKDRAKLQLKNIKTPICKGISEGKYFWSQISLGDREVPFSARASAIQAETAQVVTNIFATLSSTK